MTSSSLTSRVTIEVTFKGGEYNLAAWRDGSYDCLEVRHTMFASRIPKMRAKMMKRCLKAEARRLEALRTIAETVTV
jgi:hypothetical protein